MNIHICGMGVWTSQWNNIMDKAKPLYWGFPQKKKILCGGGRVLTR